MYLFYTLYTTKQVPSISISFVEAISPNPGNLLQNHQDEIALQVRVIIWALDIILIVRFQGQESLKTSVKILISPNLRFLTFKSLTV